MGRGMDESETLIKRRGETIVCINCLLLTMSKSG